MFIYIDLNWRFSVILWSFLQKRSWVLILVAAFLVLLLKACLGPLQDVGARPLWQNLTTSSLLNSVKEISILDFAVIQDQPLACFVCFFLIANILNSFTCNSRPFFWEWAILLSCDWITLFPYAEFLLMMVAICTFWRYSFTIILFLTFYKFVPLFPFK